MKSEHGPMTSLNQWRRTSNEDRYDSNVKP
jgi:hypothetical protein